MAAITTFNRRAQWWQGEEKAIQRDEAREGEESGTYQLYFLCWVRDLRAFVCLFVCGAERMDAISPAIHAGLLCPELQVIFHVKNLAGPPIPLLRTLGHQAHPSSSPPYCVSSLVKLRDAFTDGTFTVVFTDLLYISVSDSIHL